MTIEKTFTFHKYDSVAIFDLKEVESIFFEDGIGITVKVSIYSRVH